MYFARNISIKISGNLISKYSHKLHDHAKQSATDALKMLQKERFKKKKERKRKKAAACDLIGNKIADKITRVSKTSPQNNSGTNREKERVKDIYLQKKEKKIMIDIIIQYNNRISKNNDLIS